VRVRAKPYVTVYGYARVSTDGQSVDAQVRQLRAAGAAEVFREVASGAETDRAQLRRVIDQLDAGDVLLVTRLDRLARSTRDLLNILVAIADRKRRHRVRETATLAPQPGPQTLFAASRADIAINPRTRNPRTHCGLSHTRRRRRADRSARQQHQRHVDRHKGAPDGSPRYPVTRAAR
jgi:hypothetical protein